MKIKYAMGKNDEDFNYCDDFNSFEDAVLSGIVECELKPGDLLFIGEADVFEPTISGSSVIDQVKDEAYDHAGEHAEGWLTGLDRDKVARLGEVLTAAFNQWLLEVKEVPTFWNVENARDVEVTSQLYAKAHGKSFTAEDQVEALASVKLSKAVAAMVEARRKARGTAAGNTFVILTETLRSLGVDLETGDPKPVKYYEVRNTSYTYGGFPENKVVVPKETANGVKHFFSTIGFSWLEGVTELGTPEDNMGCRTRYSIREIT